MARKLITAADGLAARIFHPDGKGLRGVTLLMPSGVRGLSLSVAVHDEKGKRKAMNCLSLKGQDFSLQWERAILQIADYYRILPSDPLYKQMLEAKEQFLTRYGMTLETQTITFQQAQLA